MPKAILLICFSVLLFSCRTQFPIAYNANKAKNPDYLTYIQPKKGDMITGDTLTISNQAKLFKPTLLTINGSTFKPREVREYQNANGLFVNVDGSFSKALTGPNIYVFRQTGVSTSYDSRGHLTTTHSNVYYIMKAHQDQYKMVNLSSAKTLKDWVQDYDDAYEQASLALKYSRRVKMHQVFSWAGIIGGLALIAVDPSNGENGSNKVSAMSYAGLGMMCGGIINLPINGFIRRAKAGRSYASAINLYNEAPPKKKR